MTPSDPPICHARAASGPFSYTTEGAGERVVVAVHGLPGSVRDFRYLGPGLAPHARLIRLDMPGFGATPASSASGVTVEARARFVVEALDALDIARCVLVGHSMGGPVAAAAAASAPERVAGLGLIASVGVRPHRLLRRSFMRHALGSAVDRPLLGPLASRASRALMIAGGFPSSTRVEEAAQTMRVLGAFRFAPMIEATRRLRAPTLTAHADDDPFIEPEIFDELSRVVPAGPRLRWAEGGHNVQKTRSAEIVEGLVSLLAFAS